MVDRYVRMNILSSGEDKAKATLDDLAARARALEAESPDLKITADDTKASATIKDLLLKIEILNRERAEVSFETKGDEKAKATLLDIDARLRDLSEKVAKPDIKIQGTERAEADLIKIKLLLDDIHSKKIEIDAKTSDGSFLSRLFGRGGGGGGSSEGGSAAGEGESGLGSGLLSALGGANNEYFGGAIAGLIALAASIAPAVIPGALGIGAGVGGAAGAIALNKPDKAFGADLLKDLESSFLTGINGEQGGIVRSGNREGPGGIPGTSFAQELLPILKQVGGYIKSLGPELSDMFRASLPFLQMFVQFMEQLGKLLLPAFTQSMKEMQPYIPQLAQGFGYIAQGLADFIKDLGPGMKDGSVVFKAVADAIKGILIGLAFAADGLAIAFANVGNWTRIAAKNIHHWWDIVRADTASIFDDIRHTVSSVWDTLWQDMVGREMDAIMKESEMLSDFMHDVAHIFDNLRHDAASTWDDLWADLRSDATTKIDQIGSDVSRFADSITHGFDNLRHSVASVWDAMWGDAKSMAESGVRGISSAVHGIESAFETPVRFVVDNVWDKLAGIWNSIQGVVHVGFKLPVVHMASGGRIPGYGGGDQVPALLERGEVVVDKDRASALAPVFRAAGVPGFSGGGVIGGIGNFFSGIGHDLLGWLTKPLSFITSHVFGAVENLLPDIGGGGIGAVLKSLMTSVIKALTGQLHQQGASSAAYTGAYGPGVAQWAPDVRRVLGMLGLPMGDLGTVLAQMMTEIGRNPNAINLTDSNAAAGDPSRGLMQTIMTTFEAYRYPGFSNDIYNPLANIYAGLNYAIHRYGNPGWLSVLGHGHGYANGGIITEPIIGTGLKSGMRYSFGENGYEEVRPMGRSGGFGGDVYNIMVQGDTDPNGAALRIIQIVRRYKQHHGHQPTGIG